MTRPTQPIRPSGRLIIGGQVFNIDAPIVNWTEGPGWDASSEYCKPTVTLPAPGCTPAGMGEIPYGKLPKPYTRRYATRPALRTPQWHDGMTAPYDAVKNVIKQFVI